jgi:hypothetical protein
LEREFKSLEQLKGHCARCVHREIKQNRKKANVGSVEPGALADQAALQNYRGRSRSGLDSRNERYGRDRSWRKEDIGQNVNVQQGASHETRIAGQIPGPIAKIACRHQQHRKGDAHPVLDRGP